MTPLLPKQRRDFDNWRTVEQTNENENPRLGRFLSLRAEYSRTQDRGAGGLLPPIDRYMQSTKAVAIVFLIYVTKSLASDGFAFHFIRVAANVLL